MGRIKLTPIYRMTFNQPSTLQPHHDKDGEHVIAEILEDASLARVFPLKGNTESLIVKSNTLSLGWLWNE